VSSHGWRSIETLLCSDHRFSSIPPVPSVLRRMNTRYSSAVLLALGSHDVQLALDTYASAESLPSTTTDAQFQGEGWTLDGLLYEGSNLTQCFKGLSPFLLKGLDGREAQRARSFAVARGGGHPGVVNFDLHTSVGGKCFMTMPKLPTCLEVLSALSPTDTERLWIDLRDALIFLHGLGFAHMDVKPSNICVSSAPEHFVLVDLGSLEIFGKPTLSTAAYVPRDVDYAKSAASVDWWMLAMTLAEKGCGDHALLHGVRPSSVTKEEVRAHLEIYFSPRLPAAWLELRSKLLS